MFLFAALPFEFDAAELSSAAIRENVLLVPGADFHVSGGRNTFRLNFSNSKPEVIREGIARLCRVAETLLAKKETLAIR